jgi:hypothetical protein
MTDERGGVTMNELLVLFKGAQATRHTVRTTVFSRAGVLPLRGSAALGSLRSPSLRLTPEGEDEWCRQE